MIHLAIGLSVILSFLLTEIFGLLTGGLISAGYLAFFVEQPYRILSTMIIAIAIYGLIKLAGRFIILHGRRRFMFAVLLSLVCGWLFEEFSYYISMVSQDLRVIGYIIPGLIANDMVKQGVIKTTCTTLLLALIIRLIIIAGIYI